MKKITLVLALLMAIYGNAQESISGTLMPAENFTWLLVYKLEPGRQDYVADTRIIDGKFSFELPENSTPGTYRLVYAVPQDEFYFDVIYNGKENITLDFTIENGASFSGSKENKIFNAYFMDLNRHEEKIKEFYNSGNTDPVQFRELVRQLQQTQKNYETSSTGLLAHQFIKSNAPYIPKGYETVEQYINNKKEAYFKKLDIADKKLQASGFLTDKLVNYVFTALPIQPLDQEQTEQEIIGNVQTLAGLLDVVSSEFKLHLFHSLWRQASTREFNGTSDYIYITYLKSLASAANNQEIIQKIEVYNRLRRGALAPDILWKTGDDLKKLSTLDPAQNYLLVFWSSTCSHCLSELPKLHSDLIEAQNTKVVAVGLEDDDVNWKKEAAKLPQFEHAISLGKWESEYADLYAIQQTPTYYILDKDKRILVQSKEYQEVLSLLKSIM